jgi:hypothetical protein
MNQSPTKRSELTDIQGEKSSDAFEKYHYSEKVQSQQLRNVYNEVKELHFLRS